MILTLFRQKWALLLLSLLFLISLIFTRVYNIERTARFTQDESSDLVRMHQYFKDKKITLVGPISNDNSKVFGSLSYYMVMPFAAALNFHPIGPVYGTAFWGVLTALLIIAITWKINPRYTWLSAVLVLLWYPLIETSRWAWNPHFITFWIALGVLAYLKKTRTGFFLAGLFLGLSFHNHFLAGVATGVFVAGAAFFEWKNDRSINALFIISGYILAFIPFIIFDLRHPPGLFFTKYLLDGNTPHVVEVTGSSFLQRVPANFLVLTGYIALPALKWLMGGVLLWLAALEWRNIPRLLWLAPVVAQIFIGSILNELQTRYILPALVFLFVWLILPRKGLAKVLAQVSLGIMILSSMASIIPQLTQTSVPPDIYSLHHVSNLIASQIKDQNLKNANVAVLASPDSDPLGIKYRDVISLKGVGLKAASEYDASEHLFVISTSDGETVYQDGAVPMQYFRKGYLSESFIIPESQWKVYWFRYY